MFELLLATNLIMSSLGQQTFLTTNQIGQIKGSNCYGHCLDWTGTKFYVLIGNVSATAESPTLKLFCYDILLNTWTDLGAIPAGMGSNVYWSLVAVDNDTLFASCRLDKASYKISTSTWTVLPKIPSGNAITNKYGVKSFRYRNLIYTVGANASDSICSAYSYDPKTDVVTPLASSGSACGTYAGAVRYKDKIYIFPAFATNLQRVQIYDITTNTFTLGANIPAPASMMAIHEWNGLFYLMGGSIPTTGVTDRVLTYDPKTDTFGNAPILKRQSNQVLSFIYGKQISLWGGIPQGGTSYYTNFLQYSLDDKIVNVVPITGTYTKKTSGPTKYAFTSQVIDGKVYSFSGYFAAGNMSNEMNVYDPETDSWSVVTGANQPQGRYGYGCCVYEGKYWIFGGRTTTTPLDDIHCYDPVTNTWTAMGNLPSARYYPTAAVVGNKIYVQCGYTGTVQLQSNWIYDPVTKTGTDGLKCPSVMHGHNAVVYKDKIYLVGGIQGGTTRTTLIYDTVNNSWVGGGNLPVASSYGATVLRGDKMYRYGGGDASAGAPQAGLLTYDFTTNTWSSVNTGPTARSLLSMVSLPEGLWFYGGLNSVSLAESYLIT